MKRSITAVLFDADGTLYDSNKLHYLAYKAAAKQLYGHSLNWKSFYENTVVGSKKGIDVLRERNGGIDTDAFYQLKDELYRDLVSSKLQPVPGVADFLQWCRSHHIKCYVVSNSRLISLELSLSALNLEGFFESIISVEDSGDLQKPHQFPYQLALQAAQVSANQAIAVEDSSEGIASAKAAGLWCASIKHPTNRLKDLAQADLVIKNYEQLQTFLEHEQ